ncbi:hypothetical protein CsSME_00005581 [Camellia sinensis var. sinensis]
MDIKMAFLYGDLEEEIYIKQLQGFLARGEEEFWYKKFDGFMCSNGFTRCQADHCCYFKRFDKSYIILLLYVDDMLIARSSIEEAKYVKKVLKRFSIDGAKPVSTPLASHFRLTKEQSPKTEEEQAYMECVLYASAISRIIYLSGTTDMALCFRRTGIGLHGYVDVDLTGDMDNRKSAIGYIYTLSGTAVSWISQLQKIVALLTTEANQSVIHLAKNQVFHSKTKHIQLRYHFIRSIVDDGVLSLEKIQGSKNPAYMLTKIVTIDKLKLCATSAYKQEGNTSSSEWTCDYRSENKILLFIIISAFFFYFRDSSCRRVEKVYELHRLYRIQKILMTNVEHGRPNGENQERWNFMRGISLTHMNDHQIPGLGLTWSSLSRMSTLQKQTEK